MNTRSSLPRKQHKARETSPLHRKNKEIKVLLERTKYKDLPVKRVTIHKGDTVRVVRGSRAGHEGKVAEVDVRKRKVAIEKALIRKADNKEVSIWFDPSNLTVTKLDLSDPFRKEMFKMLKED